MCFSQTTACQTQAFPDVSQWPAVDLALRRCRVVLKWQNTPLEGIVVPDLACYKGVTSIPLLTSHWTELDHMTTPSRKGLWEDQKKVLCAVYL